MQKAGEVVTLAAVGFFVFVSAGLLSVPALVADGDQCGAWTDTVDDPNSSDAFDGDGADNDGRCRALGCVWCGIDELGTCNPAGHQCATGNTATCITILVERTCNTATGCVWCSVMGGPGVCMPEGSPCAPPTKPRPTEPVEDYTGKEISAGGFQ